MALVSVVRSYNFSKAELDGSRWASLSESEPAKAIGLYGSLELLCPESVAASTSFPSKTEDYKPLIHTFRWTLGLESLAQFRWPDYLADEAVNVQLIFDVYDKSVSLYEVYGVLEALPPTRAIPDTAGRRFGKSLLKVLGSLSKESNIPLLKTAGPPLAELAVNLMPSHDSKDETLWYLHRFYNDRPQESLKSYGIEWRITNRLIRTVGSRLSGVLGVLFFLAPEPKSQPIQYDTAIRARSKFGLKPKCKQREWLYFTWRPADLADDYPAWNRLPGRDLNSQPITVDLAIKKPSPDTSESALQIEP